MSDGGSTVESGIEGLVELEDELSAEEGVVVGTYREGTLAGAQKVPAAEVPDGYPVAIPTSHALALTVAAEDGTAIETFLAWPERGSDVGHVERLLDALGRDAGEFADLYGDRVALTTESGWHVLDLRRTAAIHGAAEVRSDPSLRRSEQYVAGAVGLGVVATVVWAADVAWVGDLLVVLAWLAIPTAVYLDVQEVEERMPWDADEGPWILGCLVPLFNAPIGTAYLIDRHVRVADAAPGETSDLWLWALVGSLAAHLLAVPAAAVSPLLFGVVFIYGVTLLALSVYFDAKHFDDATDWDPDEGAWAGATVVATLLLLGWAVAAVYLLKRSGATGSAREGAAGASPDGGASPRGSRSTADGGWDLVGDGEGGGDADDGTAGDGGDE